MPRPADGARILAAPGDLPLPCLLSVPAGGSSGRWPLLVFLHGYDEAAPTELRAAMTRHGPLRPGSAPAATGEFVVLAPQLPQAGDVWHRYSAELVTIVAAIEAAWPIDTDRRYLTGFSFGGNGVFDLALRHEELWAALWAVDPTRVPPKRPRLPLWLSAGAAARRAGAAFIEQLQLQSPRPGRDRVYLDQGLDHVGAAASAYADAHIYRWLLKRQRRARLVAPAHAAHTDIL